MNILNDIYFTGFDILMLKLNAVKACKVNAISADVLKLRYWTLNIENENL